MSLYFLFSEFPFSSKKHKFSNKINILWQKIILDFKVTWSYTYFSWEFLTFKQRYSFLFAYFQFLYSWTNALLKNMVVYDVLTFLQTMDFVCSTCVDLDFGVESSLLVRYGLFGVVLVSFFLFSETWQFFQ